MTVIWMVIEAIVSIGAGSILLAAFGIDSMIELVSGAILLWRLSVDGSGGDPERVERAERRASWVVGKSLALLCVYVLVVVQLSLVLGLLMKLFTLLGSSYSRCDHQTSTLAASGIL